MGTKPDAMCVLRAQFDWKLCNNIVGATLSSLSKSLCVAQNENASEQLYQFFPYEKNSFFLLKVSVYDFCEEKKFLAEKKHEHTFDFFPIVIKKSRVFFFRVVRMFLHFPQNERIQYENSERFFFHKTCTCTWEIKWVIFFFHKIKTGDIFRFRFYFARTVKKALFSRATDSR